MAGGTSGIGAAIAHAFSAAGARVTATGANEAEIAHFASRTASEISARLLDVRDQQAVRRIFEEQESLDILINCAGIIRRNDEHDPDIFADVVDVNLNGTMRMCARARPLLAKRGGSIVNLASMLSFFGGGLVPGYAASKGGIAQLTKSLAIAYASEGIRVNAVAPGWIDTPLTSALVADADRSGAILSRTPMKRWGTPEDIVGPVLFLCSPEAGFVTGVILPVDGGYAAA
ncbi:short-chain dehydrogenase [Devosia pacifica]|uniref:Short-chain dehydrogenase n=1 Tax=Devosia pacifica TaxID=1335967 RepID=A0A918VYJ4_9HYPH|nr:short-chain dehydrogenase [Devosia pacifica]